MDWLFEQNVKIQTALISATTTILLLIINCIFKFLYDKYSINYRLKKEYNFTQRKNLKNNLSNTKTPTIKAAEELNYRLMNFRQHITENWHKKPKNQWITEKGYYLRSFVYMWLIFFFWVEKAEESIYSLDIVQMDKNDHLYFKYIKTLKHFFTDKSLLKDLRYPSNGNNNHFYKYELKKVVEFVKNNNCEPISYIEFEKKFCEDYSDIHKVILYITEISNNQNNKNYNVIKCFHLFLVLFLNKYGLEYQHTSYKEIYALYSKIEIKNGLLEFLIRNKIIKESYIILKIFFGRKRSIKIQFKIFIDNIQDKLKTYLIPWFLK